MTGGYDNKLKVWDLRAGTKNALNTFNMEMSIWDLNFKTDTEFSIAGVYDGFRFIKLAKVFQHHIEDEPL